MTSHFGALYLALTFVLPYKCYQHSDSTELTLKLVLLRLFKFIVVTMWCPLKKKIILNNSIQAKTQKGPHFHKKRDNKQRNKQTINK